MPNNIKELSTQVPAIAYARLLIDMHRLIGEGKGDSQEAEALADRMDAPWYAMTAKDQDRMRGLAADLNALREGAPRRVDMSPEQRARWHHAAVEAHARSEFGDVDAVLKFLRQPVPAQLPPKVIPFLQANCWDKLGDLETALVFMKEADRQDPEQALSVLILLQQLERLDELPEYANRVIANPVSSSLDLYLAAVALMSMTRRMSDSDATPILRRAVNTLKRALSVSLVLPREERENTLDTDAYISQALGLGLQRLGERKAAIDVYSEAITRHQRNGELLMARGLALYDLDVPSALADFVKAVRLGVAVIWPYLHLARHALQGGAPGEALRLAQAAERQPGPAAARAEVYEIIAIALAELGQPQERVRENFDLALTFDPKNDRIRQNREIAAAPPLRSRGERAGWPQLLQAPSIKPEGLREALSDQINNHSEFLKEQHSIRVSEGLAAV
jgi:tetratricopeptide (TPR) repeat protein